MIVLTGIKYVDLREARANQDVPYPHEIYLEFRSSHGDFTSTSPRDVSQVAQACTYLIYEARRIVGTAKDQWRPSVDCDIGMRFASATSAARFKLLLHLPHIQAHIEEDLYR